MNKNKDSISIPKHIAVIMDGNRRWAKERNLPTFEGHSKGYETLNKSIDWFFKAGIKTVSFYAFSAENWKREQDEVNYLMKLLEYAINTETEKAMKDGYRLLVSGRINELPGVLPELVSEATLKTKNGTVGTVNFCINYGGRQEIVDAFVKMIKNNVSLEQVHEGIIKKYLYNPYLDDPEIIVRTSGEKRLSNFLMWQSAYSELFFINKYWPDFEKTDVDSIISEFNLRDRRYGK